MECLQGLEASRQKRKKLKTMVELKIDYKYVVIKESKI